MTLIQWVNLEKDDAYVADSDVGSKDRCGKLSIKTVFAKDEVPLQYKVKVTPSGSDNITYTAAELGRGRNPKFKMTKGRTDLGTEAEVLMTDEIQLPAAGGNKYKIEAKDANDVIVCSEEIEAKRKMYYQHIYMDDASGKVIPYSLVALEEHCKKHHVVLTKAGDDKKIPFQQVLNTDSASDNAAFESNVKTAYDLPEAFKKVGCAAVFVDYIASPEEFRLNAILELGEPPDPYSFCVVYDTAILVMGESVGEDYLWHFLGTGKDASKNDPKDWFVAGEILFTSPGSSKPVRIIIDCEDVSIGLEDASIGLDNNHTYGGFKDVVIKIQPELRALLANQVGTIEIRLKLLKPSGFIAGLSNNGAIVCAARVQWEDIAHVTALKTWKHEFGHRMGMVAYGDKRNSTHGAFHYNPRRILPDAPPSLYGERAGENDKGHCGPHCEKGARYNAATRTWSGTPECIMFGSTRNGDDYCQECAEIVRKLDLSGAGM